MMMSTKVKTVFLATLFMPIMASASEISLEYASFHDRMKLVNKGEYPRIELTFSVPKRPGCIIQNGEITTSDKKSYPLSFTADQRLYIPFDSNLKQNRGLVRIETDGDATTCGLALQIRERVPKQSYSGEELSELKQEMDKLQAAMQGFPLKYFAKPADGLRFDFGADDILVTIDGIEKVVRGELILEEEALKNVKTLTAAKPPLVVSPFFNRAE